MTWKLEELAGSEFRCQCGHTHRVPIQKIRMGKDALGHLEEDIPEMHLSGKALIVADETTFGVAGQQVEVALQQARVDSDRVILRPRHNLQPANWVLPDERSLGEVLLKVPEAPGFLVAVGSGTINDVTRFVAHKTGMPFVSVGTAASMDGYASTVAALLTGSFKKTVPAAHPLAIYVDPDILATAPLEMAAAGFGDLLGKSIALADWRLSHIINGEYYCPTIAGIVEQVLATAIKDVAALSSGDPEALLRLTEGLILSGVAILMFGDSRPVSGAEHELAHFWEIQALAHGRLFYHGDKVAIGTLLMTEMYDRVLSIKPETLDWEKIYRDRPPITSYMETLQQDFAGAWEALYSPNWKQTKLEELKRPTGNLLAANWDRIKEEVPQSLLKMDEIRGYLAALGLCQTPQELGIKREWLEASLRSGREMKPHRYTIMDLAAEMGCLDIVSNELLKSVV
ncbi:MAG: sn-glycerol-1-phosphate dehydrogenase [Firmicutes bacterium]|nr:sn-glycerol-1-phosphate dehydrogenase [Bacillota bacterium]